MVPAPLFRAAERAPRTPWLNFPDVLVHQDIPTVQGHPQYGAAKGGDIAAAQRLVEYALRGEIVDSMASALRDRSALLVPVFAEEVFGVNRIPAVMAESLEARLAATGADVRIGTDIVQANRAGHTGASGWTRIAHPPIFAGTVENGAHYVIVDDFIGQGGTIANLKGYIESNGGRVVLATTLTGQAYSAKLAPAEATLEALRAKHGQALENWIRDTFGYGFDRLTESEARYLTRAETLDVIRNRLAQARSQADR